MREQDSSTSSIFFTYFGFGTVAGILFALLVMAVSNAFITHHDESTSVSVSHHSKYK